MMVTGLPLSYDPPAAPDPEYLKAADGVTDVPDADGNQIEVPV